MKLVWKRNERQYATGELCFAGKVNVGSVHMPTVSKGQPTIWRAKSDLPGFAMKAGTTDFPTMNEAKARLEKFVTAWFSYTQEDAA